MKYEIVTTHKIIDLLGGVRPAAKKLDCGPATVANWKKKSKIPRWWLLPIETVANENGIPLKLIEGALVFQEGPKKSGSSLA